MADGIESAFAGFLSEPDGLCTSQSGKLWLSFSVGVGEGDGKQWVRVVVFGDKAAELAPKLHKGGRVYVEGKLSVDKWMGKDGHERHGLKVAAFRVELLNQIGRNRPGKIKPRPNRSAGQVKERPASNAVDLTLNDEVPW